MTASGHRVEQRVRQSQPIRRPYLVLELELQTSPALACPPPRLSKVRRPSVSVCLCLSSRAPAFPHHLFSPSRFPFPSTITCLAYCHLGPDSKSPALRRLLPSLARWLCPARPARLLGFHSTHASFHRPRNPSVCFFFCPVSSPDRPHTGRALEHPASCFPSPPASPDCNFHPIFFVVLVRTPTAGTASDSLAVWPRFFSHCVVVPRQLA
jgi:hypothetical protein